MKPEENPNDPESIEIEQAQIDQARAQMAEAMLKTAHNWRQSGTMVECTSCPFNHGFAVPPGHFLTSIDDKGKPVFTQAW